MYSSIALGLSLNVGLNNDNLCLRLFSRMAKVSDGAIDIIKVKIIDSIDENCSKPMSQKKYMSNGGTNIMFTYISTKATSQSMNVSAIVDHLRRDGRP